MPIDAAPAGGGAASYKGLPLTLAQTGSPVVSPVAGVIGVVCIGMSNSSQECTDFISHADRGDYAGQISPAVRFANCAVGSHAIERWNDPAFDGMLWDACLSGKLAPRGIGPEQVRVIWHKAADQFTTGPGGAVYPPYPDAGSDYFRFRDNLGRFAARLREKFPSVQAVYTSSRSYGGFASSPARGEPLSYEEGHALNAWLASGQQAAGVWFGWGPYLWAPPCTSAQVNGSGICYDRADFQSDGVHPAQGALSKICGMLHARFSKESWYRP